MNVRTVHTSLGIVCAAGLAIAGIGWPAEEQPRPTEPKQVFCDIDRLMPYHPAWDQIEQVRGVEPQAGVAAMDDATPALALEIVPSSVAEHGTDTITRDVLKTRLEARAQEQLTQIDRQLTASLSRRMDDTRQQLRAEADAKEAEARRKSELEFAERLRAAAGDPQFERTEAAIKLAALKAQVSSPGVNSDAVKAAVEAKERELAAIRSEARSKEQKLKSDLAADLAAVREQESRHIDEELADLQSKERRRIDDLLHSRRERLKRDLAADDDDFRLTSEMRRYMSASDVGTSAVVRARQLRSECCSEFGDAAEKSVAGISGFRNGLHERTRTELRAVIERIARKNGLRVTFQPVAGAEDRTKWFRDRLPYSRGQGQAMSDEE